MDFIFDDDDASVVRLVGDPRLFAASILMLSA